MTTRCSCSPRRRKRRASIRSPARSWPRRGNATAASPPPRGSGRCPAAVGGPALVRELDADSPPQLDGPTRAWRARGAAVLHVLRDGEVAGVIALEDQVRPDSREAVDELHRLGARVAMVTGDARQVADA